MNAQGRMYVACLLQLLCVYVRGARALNAAAMFLC